MRIYVSYGELYGGENRLERRVKNGSRREPEHVEERRTPVHIAKTHREASTNIEKGHAHAEEVSRPEVNRRETAHVKHGEAEQHVEMVEAARHVVPRKIIIDLLKLLAGEEEEKMERKLMSRTRLSPWNRLHMPLPAMRILEEEDLRHMVKRLALRGIGLTLSRTEHERKSHRLLFWLEREMLRHGIHVTKRELERIVHIIEKILRKLEKYIEKGETNPRILARIVMEEENELKILPEEERKILSSFLTRLVRELEHEENPKTLIERITELLRGLE